MNGEFLSLAAQSLNAAVMNLLIFLYCRKTDPPPPKSKAVYMITYVLSTALFISVNRLSASLDIPIINFFFMFIYVNALSITFFKTPPKKALLYNLFCFLFLIFSDIFTVIAWSVMKGESLKAVLSNSLYVSLSCLTNIFIMIAGYSIFSVAYSKNELPSLKIRHTLLITVFCFFELFAEYNFSIRIKNRTDGIVTLIMIIGFMLLNLYAVYVIKVTENAYRVKFELAMMKKQSEMQLEHYNEINEKYEKARRMIHDFNKHISVMNSLSSADSNDGTRYSAEVEHEINSVFGKFHCSDKILSIIMSNKISEAEALSVSVDTRIEDITFSNISDIDMTAIFTNLWDNAIEASKKLSEGRVIKVVIGKVNDYCIVCFENSFNGELKQKAGQIISSKNGHNGTGLSIIRYTAEKYGGSASFSAKENTFTAKVILPTE